MLALTGLCQLETTAKWVASGEVDENIEILCDSVSNAPELAKQIFAVEGLA